MYKVSEWYQGSQGKRYFLQYESGMRRLDHQSINKRFFCSYIRPEADVLDFGCGDGRLLSYLDCARRVGVEPNAVARAEAQKRGIITAGSLEEVSGTFDVVISSHVLEHVLNPVETLTALGEKMKAGGVLLLLLPLDDWRVQRKFQENIDHHLYTWTPLLLGNLLKEAGFTSTDIRIITHAVHPAIIRAIWKLFRRAPRAASFVADIACLLIATGLKRRQLFAVARYKDAVSRSS